MANLIAAAVAFAIVLVGAPFAALATCGDLTVDPGEECDLGTFDEEDCCSDSCTFEPAGTRCDVSNLCTYSTCDAAGACVAPTCAQASGSRVLGKSALYNDEGRISWQWRSIAAVDVADFGDPTTTTGITLCNMYGPDDYARFTVHAGQICPPDGHACWRRTSSGWLYTPGGLPIPPGHFARIALRPGEPGKGKIIVKVKGAPAGHMPWTAPHVLRLVRDDSPLCWESTFTNLTFKPGPGISGVMKGHIP